jgi:N-acetylmuramoyl-L-alanine amidase
MVRHSLSRILCSLVLAGPLLLPCGPSFAATQVKDVRIWSDAEGTRIVLDLSAHARHEVFTLENPDRVVIDLKGGELAVPERSVELRGPVKALRSGRQPNEVLRLVLDLDGARKVNSFLIDADEGSAGARLVVDLVPPGAALPQAPTAKQVLAAAAASVASQKPQTEQPVKSVSSAARGRDLVIAVDAGHGGQDPGAIGRGGTREKDITLAIAKRLAEAINAEDGMRAVLVRNGDHFISLRGRIRKAREHGADMFVSVHADAVKDRSVRGSSVYVLSLRGASDEASRWLAERENAADLIGGVSLDDKNDVLASVLLDVTQKEAVSDSVEAASRVLRSLGSVGRVHGNRVRHAGFVVLKSPDIPSMLVETAFISNAADERRLRDPGEQKRIAAAIHDGVREYFYDNPPPGTKVAALSAARRNGGQLPPQAVAGR